MVPTIGRIVVYNTTEIERKALSELGNNSQEKLPAVIVAAWGDTEDSLVNLKVMVDGGQADLWRTSVHRGDEPGNWNWPERV